MYQRARSIFAISWAWVVALAMETTVVTAARAFLAEGRQARLENRPADAMGPFGLLLVPLLGAAFVGGLFLVGLGYVTWAARRGNSTMLAVALLCEGVALQALMLLVYATVGVSWALALVGALAFLTAVAGVSTLNGEIGAPRISQGATASRQSAAPTQPD